MPGLRHNVPWPVVIGFFGGGFGGCCYEMYSAYHSTRPVEAADLPPLAGYAPTDPPPGIPANTVAASWRRGNDRVLVRRVKGAAIDAKRLETLRREIPSAWRGDAATIQRAELRTIQNYPAAVIEASATGPTGEPESFRWALVGNAEHATILEEIRVGKSGEPVFDSMLIRVSTTMRSLRLRGGVSFNNWILRGAMLGMLAGAVVTRIRAHRKKKSA